MSSHPASYMHLVRLGDIFCGSDKWCTIDVSHEIICDYFPYNIASHITQVNSKTFLSIIFTTSTFFIYNNHSVTFINSAKALVNNTDY